MCATNSFLKSLGVEIYASGHRRWPDEAKAQAVADTLEPVFAPLVVCDVPEVQPEPDIAASAEVIRIVSGEVRIELAPGTSAIRIAEIVHALGATPC